MKRSQAIALGAMGVLVAGAWLGSGKTSIDDTGEGDVDAAIYGSVQDCITANVLTPATCEAEFRLLEEKHVATAPKFPDKASCESRYGAAACTSTTFNGASVFVPAMVGMLVANHLSTQRQAQALYPAPASSPACQPGQTPQTQPGCVMPRNASGSSGSGWRSYSTSSGRSVSRDLSRVASAAIRIPAAMVTSSASRSNLGSVSSSSSSAASTVSRGGFGSTGSASSSSS